MLVAAGHEHRGIDIAVVGHQTFNDPHATLPQPLGGRVQELRQAW